VEGDVKTKRVEVFIRRGEEAEAVFRTLEQIGFPAEV
jgi:hypothetical protein